MKDIPKESSDNNDLNEPTQRKSYLPEGILMTIFCKNGVSYNIQEGKSLESRLKDIWAAAQEIGEDI